MVEAAALGVEEPTVFVEITTHVSDVNSEHVFIIIGSARVGMRDGPFGIIEREPIAMDGSGEVDVLGIHEVALVEESCFYHSLGAKEHETAAEVRCVDRTREIEVS